MKDYDIAPFIVASLLIGAVTVGGGGFIGSFTDNMSFTCRNVEGEIVGKSHDEGWFKIYVSLYNDSVSGDGHSDYAVYVGPETYDRYEIGHTYTERMCDLETHNEFKQFLQEMIDAGFLEQGS